MRKMTYSEGEEVDLRFATNDAVGCPTEFVLDKNYDNICNAPITECAYVKITDYDIDNEGNYTRPVKESWCVLSLNDLVMLKEDIDRFLKAMDESHEM